MSLAAYRESFEAFSAALPQADESRRRKHLDRFLAAGFPNQRSEAWRFTNLSALTERAYRVAGVAEQPTAVDDHPLAGADRLVYLNGHLQAATGDTNELHEASVPALGAAGPDSVAELNAAFVVGGFDLRLAAGERRLQPLHVIFAGISGGAAEMTHQHHRIELGEAAEAIVVLEFFGQGEAARLSTQIFDVLLKPGARLRLYRICREAAAATLLCRIDARIDREASLNAVTIDYGAGLVRQDFNVRLIGTGAEAELSGLYVPGSGAHIDNQTRIVHDCTHGRSRERYRGIVGERARAIFNGRVEVRPGAQKTDSEQRIANLLLSPRAQVNAKPELEIYADDVKCAHGATVGQLDLKALDYLRLRGIDGESARALLLRAFASEILEKIEFPDLRRRLETDLGFAPDLSLTSPGEME